MILMFCGVPASGKSAIATNLKERLDDVHMIVSDEIRGSRYDRIMRWTESRLGKQEYLIIDATFYKEKWRRRLREIARDKEKVLTILVDCSLEVCLKRNKEREESIPESAIYIIWNGFSRPTNPDIEINTDEKDTDEATQIILNKIIDIS